MITFEDRYSKIEGDNPEQPFSTELVKVRVPCKHCGSIGAVKGKWSMEKCIYCLGKGYVMEDVVKERGAK